MRRALEAASLGEAKFDEFTNNMKVLESKIQQYVTFSRMPGVDQKMFDLLRLEIEGHMSTALDAIDFVRHRSNDDRKFLEEAKKIILE